MVYKNVFDSLAEVVNKSKYFNSIFSWLVIFFTFYSIGNRGGVIWKYLLYATTLGLIATCCNIVYTVSKNLDYYHYDKFILLIWVEGICLTFTEWIYIYINFLKIRSCINILKKNLWRVIMGIILVYSLIIRIALVYFDYNQYLKAMENPEDKYIMEDPNYKSLKNTAYAFLYFPLGLICLSFIYFIIKELVEENDEFTRKVIYIVLQSTLSRMGFVSLIFIGISIIVHLSPDGYFGFIRDLLWRLKDNLGMIFLIDILLIRIDLDSNKINMKKQEIEKAKKIYPSKEDVYSDSGHYNCGSTVVNDYNDYIQIKNYEFPSKNEPDYYDTDDVYEAQNYQSMTSPLRSGFDIKSIISSYVPQETKSCISVYGTQDHKSYISAYGTQDHKSCISTYSTKSIEFAIPPAIKAKNSRKRSGQSLYSNIDSTYSNVQNTHNRANSVVLGNKVYSKVPLSPTLSETKSVVSSVFTYTGSKVSSGNELCVHQVKNSKRTPSNILIESDLL